MTERWLDQFLGEPLGDATRDEVLTALRGHILRELVADEENPDGTTRKHIAGCLVEASRNPDTWENTELFSVVTEQAGAYWHNDNAWLERLATENQAVREALEALEQPPLLTFGVPETGIIQYPGAEPGTSGYRFTRDDGSALAIVLWFGVMFLTDSGDIAPGMGGFTVNIEPESDAQD